MTRRGRLRDARIQERESAGEEEVFNLRVSAPHTFIAGAFVVHNKGGGCFPAGTEVATPGGNADIERLVPGDAVVSVTDKGTIIQSVVRKVFLTRSPLLTVKTDFGTLRTTAEHPVLLANGGFLPAGQLAAGERILLKRGGELMAATVRGKWTEEEEEVFNLEVDEPHTFIADGFVVHNKGGGFSSRGYRGGGRSSSGESRADAPTLFFFCAFSAIFLTILIVGLKQHRDENLDFVFSRSAIAPKARKTLELLEFISKVDPAFAPAELEKVAESTFVQLQECWQARRYEPMKPLLMPDLYANHVAQLAGMIRNGEINVIVPGMCVTLTPGTNASLRR